MIHKVPEPAARMADITPFHVMDILGRAKALEAKGRDIIHMEVGEPDFPTPQPIVEAGLRALADGKTKYTSALGLAPLREAIAGFYQQRYGVHIPPERIAVTTGASSALLLAMSALVDPGDEVLLADPGYPCDNNIIRLLGGKPVDIPVGPDTAYQLTPDLVSHHLTDVTTVIMVSNPSNPTGTMVSPEDMQGILAIARDKEQSGGRARLALVVDEVYLGLVYEGRDKTGVDTSTPVGTALTLSDEMFVISGFSKYFGMTGWRLGWLVVPERFMPEIEKLAQNIYLAAPTVAQYGALAAFEPETLAVLEDQRKELQDRRDFLLPALRDLGFHIPVEPQGAFFIYANCQHFTEDSLSFALGLLEEAGVAVTPGVDFGHNAPGQHIRFTYTMNMERLREGVRRLGEYISSGRSI